MALSFLGCQTRLGTRMVKRLMYQTWLERVNEDMFAVRFHRTLIVFIHRDGTYTINSGGWQTVTTKRRICRYSPARVSQRKFVWYVGGDLPFNDHMRIGGDGLPFVSLPEVVSDNQDTGSRTANVLPCGLTQEEWSRRGGTT